MEVGFKNNNESYIYIYIYIAYADAIYMLENNTQLNFSLVCWAVLKEYSDWICWLEKGLSQVFTD